MAPQENSVTRATGYPLGVKILIAAILSVLILDLFYGLKITVTHLTLISILVILVLFPYFTSLKIPGLIELRREIEGVKQQFDTIRAQLATLQFSSQSLTLNLGTQVSEALEREKQLRETVETVHVTDDEYIQEIKDLLEQRRYIASVATLREILRTKLTELTVSGSKERRKLRDASFERIVDFAVRASLISSSLGDRIILIDHTLTRIIYSFEPIPATLIRDVITAGIEIVSELPRRHGTSLTNSRSPPGSSG